MEATALVTAPAIVRVAGLHKRYRQRPAVQGIDLEVRRGDIYGLIGPDGAGKSSLMKAVAGVLIPDAGRIEVFGIPLDSERAAERIKSQLGFMPQGLGLNLYPDLSVEENIDYFARLRLVPETTLARRKDALLAMTRLARFRDRPMKQLSGGMKQKLGLVCTLIHEPALVVLDEPTTGVDPISRRDFWNILRTLVRERGITAIVSTAYLDEASRFDRLALLYGGEVLARGTPDELLALGPGHAATRDGEPELESVFISLLRQRGVTEAPETARRQAGAIPRAPHDGVAVEVRGVTRDFRAFRAVDGVTFDIRHGEIFGLLGANGAGKTTVIKMLTGLLAPSAGSAHVAGVDMRRAARAVRQRIGYVSQAFSLYSDLTVAENLALSAGVYGLDAARSRERISWAVDMGRLRGHEHDLARDLPMGLRQRLALGCALLHEPPVLFLDEPTSGVDPLGRRRFWQILQQLAREDGVAILITTHYMSEAEHCDRVGLMHAGRLVELETPAAMKHALEVETGAAPGSVSLEDVFVSRVSALERAEERAA
jgi:ABC-type multidrug transport system ATPase subunit